MISIGSLIWLFVKGKSASNSAFELIAYLFLASLFLISLFIMGYFRGVKLRNNIDNVKNGNIKYEPYTIDKTVSNNYDKFICYINETEIIGLDNFLNYKYDGVHCLDELNSIEFLEYNSNDPRLYFEEHKI